MWVIRHTKLGKHTYQWVTDWENVIAEMVRGNEDDSVVESHIFARDHIAEMVINSAISKQNNK